MQSQGAVLYYRDHCVRYIVYVYFITSGGETGGGGGGGGAHFLFSNYYANYAVVLIGYTVVRIKHFLRGRGVFPF